MKVLHVSVFYGVGKQTIYDHKYYANKKHKNAFISTFVTNFYSGDFARFFNLKEQKHDQRMRVLTIF